MKKRNVLGVLAALALVLSGCHTPPTKLGANTPDAASPLFADVTKAAGITNTHHKPILDHQIDNINSWVSSEIGRAHV